MSNFNYLAPFITSSDAQKLAGAILLGGILVGTGAVVTRRISTAQGLQSAIIPEERISVFGVLDFFVDAFTKFHDSIVGVENRRHVPFTGSIFLFLVTANLLGLFPGMPAITTTVWVNVGMALVVFVYFNFQGVKAHGVWGYIKHFMGPVWWLAPLLFPVEILSTGLRILTLNLRLYWNISSDHTVLEIFTNGLSLPIGFSAPLYALGFFVAFIQAFIFTVLTMVYILLASSHEEDDHHEEGHQAAGHQAAGHQVTGHQAAGR